MKTNISADGFKHNLPESKHVIELPKICLSSSDSSKSFHVNVSYHVQVFFFLLSDEGMYDYNHRMVWIGRNFTDHLVPTPVPQSGTPSARPGCPKAPSKLRFSESSSLKWKRKPAAAGEKEWHLSTEAWGNVSSLFVCSPKESEVLHSAVAAQHRSLTGDAVTMLLATGSSWHAQRKREVLWKLRRLKQWLLM